MFRSVRRAPSIARQHRGFTLVESLVGVSVAAVLAAVGVPSLSSTQARQTVQAELNEFQGAVLRARSEAMRRGELVTVCALDPAAAIERPTCLPSGKNWSAGWLVFVDRGDRGDMDESDDQLIVVHQAADRAGQVASSLRYLSFQSTGISASASSRFQFRPQGADAAEANPAGSRLVCISKPGRMRVTQSASC